MIRLVAYWKEQLRRNQIPVAWMTSECLAQHSFRFTGSILIGSIEESDPLVQCRIDASDYLRARNAASHREPCAEA